jgi:hypothetical protein
MIFEVITDETRPRKEAGTTYHPKLHPESLNSRSIKDLPCTLHPPLLCKDRGVLMSLPSSEFVVGVVMSLDLHILLNLDDNLRWEG